MPACSVLASLAAMLVRRIFENTSAVVYGKFVCSAATSSRKARSGVVLCVSMWLFHLGHLRSAASHDAGSEPVFRVRMRTSKFDLRRQRGMYGDHHPHSLAHPWRSVHQCLDAGIEHQVGLPEPPVCGRCRRPTRARSQARIADLAPARMDLASAAPCRSCRSEVSIIQGCLHWSARHVSPGARLRGCRPGRHRQRHICSVAISSTTRPWLRQFRVPNSTDSSGVAVRPAWYGALPVFLDGADI